MNIGMILDNEFTGDMRVENEVYSLSQAGFNVFVLCFNHGEKPSKEDFHGAQIIRVNISKFKKNKMKGLTNTIVDLYTNYWKGQIASFAKEYNIDVLHVHDLYMLGAAYKANAKLSKQLPVVADLHENYAAALKYYKFSNSFPGKYIISIPKWERTEVTWVNKADHVVTVIEEAKDRYINLGVPADKISVVANYVNSDFFLSEYNDDALVQKFDSKFVISYMGGFDSHRGLESVIKALPLLKETIPNIMVVLVGTGRNELELKELANTLNVADLVSFEGWQSPKKMPLYCEVSNICLIPHLKTEHTDNTIPHKLFQYMLLERPVLASNCDPFTRILKESESGLTFTSNDEQDLANKVIQLFQDPTLAAEMGKKGKAAVETLYNWDDTVKNLINLYKNLDQ